MSLYVNAHLHSWCYFWSLLHVVILKSVLVISAEVFKNWATEIQKLISQVFAWDPVQGTSSAFTICIHWWPLNPCKFKGHHVLVCGEKSLGWGCMHQQHIRVNTSIHKHTHTQTHTHIHVSCSHLCCWVSPNPREVVPKKSSGEFHEESCQ